MKARVVRCVSLYHLWTYIQTVFKNPHQHLISMVLVLRGIAAEAAAAECEEEKSHISTKTL